MRPQMQRLASQLAFCAGALSRASTRLHCKCLVPLSLLFGAPRSLLSNETMARSTVSLILPRGIVVLRCSPCSYFERCDRQGGELKFSCVLTQAINSPYSVHAEPAPPLPRPALSGHHFTSAPSTHQQHSDNEQDNTK